MKLIDDMRILVTLRDGGTVRDCYKSGYGFSNPPLYYCAVEAGEDRYRFVSKKALYRCRDQGLIVASGSASDRGWDRDLTHALTEKGAEAAGAIGFTIDDAVKAPKQPSEATIARKKAEREAQRKAEDEERELNRRHYDARHAMQSIYGCNRRIVRSRDRWRVCKEGQVFDPDYWLNGVVEDRGFTEIAHLLEEFVGIDGLVSFRVSAEGVERVERRMSLLLEPVAKAAA